MLTAERAQTGTTRNELDRAAEWERAVQVLDLSPALVRRLKTPQIECVSRHPSLGGGSDGVARLHIAANERSCEESLVRVSVGAGCSGANTAAEAQQIQLAAALAGMQGAGAAIGLQIPVSAIGERDLWQLSRDCAAVVARVVGDARLFPADVASAAFARWMSEAAAQFGVKLRMGDVDPAEYAAELDELRSDTILCLTSLALHKAGKKLATSRASVIGTGPIARQCLQKLEQAGARLVAVADESGAVMNTAGLEVPELLRHIRSGGLLAEYPGAQHALHSEAAGVAAEVILLCAEETELTEDNVSAIRSATVVIDGSGHCVTCGAALALSACNVQVIDQSILWGMEMVPELLPGVHRLTRSGRGSRLRQHVEELWGDIQQFGEKYALPLYSATLALGIHRLAVRMGGVRP